MSESETSGKAELEEHLELTCAIIDDNPLDPIQNLNVLLNVIADIAVYSLSKEAADAFISTLSATLCSLSVEDVGSEGELH
jgi:hypothetical protein